MMSATKSSLTIICIILASCVTLLQVLMAADVARILENCESGLKLTGMLDCVTWHGRPCSRSQVALCQAEVRHCLS